MHASREGSRLVYEGGIQDARTMPSRPNIGLGSGRIGALGLIAALALGCDAIAG